MITIVNYGVGNILAFVNLYKRINVRVHVANSSEDLSQALKVILPGVGDFDQAITRLNRSGMRETLEELVMGNRVPIMGVCVGMQMLSEGSEEGKCPGLGWIKGYVRSLRGEVRVGSLPVPHMGWNDIHAMAGSRLFTGLEKGALFYFLHSYFFSCSQKRDEAAITQYGADICCAVEKDNIYGVQFHPEKSHRYGCQLLQNFATM